MKVALIGCGFFAQNHLHAWHDIDGVDVVALCDSDPAKLAATGQAFGITRHYTDAAALFQDGGFDIVDIATTVGSHWPLVELAARNAVHVICQKPFAENMVDARAMVSAVEAAGKTLMVHENFRWQSAVRTVIDAVRGGAIGQPFFGRVSFRSGYDVFSGQPYLAEGERFIIEDLGIHILDIARALFGDVARLSATTRRINPAIKGEDVATMLLDHTSGVSSVVDCSYATRRQPETFPQSLIEVDGDQGTLRLDAGYIMTLQANGRTETRDLSPPVLPWASTPWHNIQESVRIIQQHFVDCLHRGARAGKQAGATTSRHSHLSRRLICRQPNTGRLIRPGYKQSFALEGACRLQTGQGMTKSGNRCRTWFWFFGKPFCGQIGRFCIKYRQKRGHACKFPSSSVERQRKLGVS